MDPVLDSLLKAQPALWRGRDRYTNTASIPTGFAALDNALPARGWSIGGVTELLVEQHGIGELSLLLPALRHVARHTDTPLSADKDKTGWAALINPPHIPYAPAFSNAGIALDRLLIVNTGNDINTLWATEQILRSGLFGAVIAWVQKSSAQRQRRLQLAAEAGHSWGVVYRPLQACKEHSPVATRIRLSLSSGGAPSGSTPSGSTPSGSTPSGSAPSGRVPISRHPSSNHPSNNHPAGNLLSEHPPQQLTLDIFKLRAGNPQIVTISPEEFDASQGSEWPVPKPAPVLRGVNTNISSTALRPLSGVPYVKTHSNRHDAAGPDSTDH